MIDTHAVLQVLYLFAPSFGILGISGIVSFVLGSAWVQTLGAD